MRGSRFMVAGLMFSAGVAMVVAQQGRQGGGGGGGPTALVVNKAVQEDVKMTEEQIEKVKGWAKEFGTKRMEANKEAFAGLKDLGAEERTAKMAEMAAATSKEAYKELADVLKPEQMKRVKQIDIQNSGVNAFTNADVVAALKLTDEQKTTIKAVTAEFRKDSGEIRTEAGFGGGGKGAGGKGGGKGFDATKMADMNKKISKLQKESMDKISEKLTADQVKAWKELTGEAFDTTKLQGGFGGGNTKKKDVE